MRYYLICYDIACPRRLARVHRLLQGRALALQYSLFLFQGSEAALQSCLTALAERIDTDEDDVRAYPLPQRGLHWQHGRPLLANGLYWTGLPPGWPQAGQPADTASMT